MAVIPPLERWSFEDQEFEASLCYTVNSGQTWDIRDPVSEREREKRKERREILSQRRYNSVD